jgi:hypothetical protein
MSDKKPCCVRVYPNCRAGSFRGHMCQKAAKVEREGKWYCGIHDPVTAEDKRAQRHAAWEVEYEASKAKNRLQSAAPDLLFALKNLLAVKNGEGGTVFNSDEIALAAIAKAEGTTPTTGEK